jgi:hypothetical protein
MNTAAEVDEAFRPRVDAFLLASWRLLRHLQWNLLLALGHG